MELIEQYKQLAERNGWTFILDEVSHRPYFMKDGDYAVPDELTTEEDKDLLATIIAEGSEQLKRIILMCWKNNIQVTGPCSGIREAHDYPPFSLHLGIVAPSEITTPLHSKLYERFPEFNYLSRAKGEKVRYDIHYFLSNIELTKEQSEQIFEHIANELEKVIEEAKNKQQQY